MPASPRGPRRGGHPGTDDFSRYMFVRFLKKGDATERLQDIITDEIALQRL